MAGPKEFVTVGRRRVRQDCLDNDCHEEGCDVCHVHDEPADPDTGLCTTCDEELDSKR